MKAINWTAWEKAVNAVAGVGAENAMTVMDFKYRVGKYLQVSPIMTITVEDLANLAEKGLPLWKFDENGEEMICIIGSETEKEAYLKKLRTIIRNTKGLIESDSKFSDLEQSRTFKDVIRLENAIRKFKV